MASQRSVAVIGGGISGLAAAFRLCERAAELELPLTVTLFEASDRLGGAIETIHRDGFVIEAGADSFLSEKPAGLELVERLGLTNQLVRTQPQFRRTMVVRKGHLIPIPDGFSLVAPTYLAPLVRSSLFSPICKLRILLEPLIPRRQATQDESVADFVSRRLGREVLERVAQPLAAGIYTGDPAQLSAAATLTRFVEMERRYGSVIRGLRIAARNLNDARNTSGARWSLFVSLRCGMGSLIKALRDKLSGSIRLNATIASLERDSSCWSLRLSDGSRVQADAIVCTTPAFAAAQLIESLEPELSSELRGMAYASTAVVNLAYRLADLPKKTQSFGFVVPAVEQRRIIAGSFSSLKFADRAPEGMLLARVFLGGALNQNIASLPDDSLIAASAEELRDLLEMSAPPLFAHLRRWPDSMPQYTVGHIQRAHRIRDRAAALPNLIFAGAYLDGVGIPDCIRQGEAAADSVIANLCHSMS
jgi:oxygen-dependent protoporphyrinogen oxidase